MPITYESLYSAIVTILTLLLFLFMAAMVGRMRERHKVPAPAITGHPQFERAFRVHYNTLEQLVVFLPLLWLATILYRGIGWLPATFGLLFVIGRALYMQGYMADPKKRSTGMMLGLLANAALLILSIIGIVQDWTALSAV